VVRAGDARDVVPIVAKEVDAAAVYVSADFGGNGRERDRDVAASLELGGRQLLRVGSPYAVDPGTVRKRDDQPFGVFTPFCRAWRTHGWAQSLAEPVGVRWVDGVLSEGIRDRPADDATSRLSPYLKFGCIHPRQVLAHLGSSEAHEKLRRELAWREFYADIVWHRPGSTAASLHPAMAGMRLDSGPLADQRFRAWAEGRTGYPLVDAGMRQLLGEAWVHNRVRMIVASFLVKDLHIDWTRGARWFLRHLVDGDKASNSHGWQWVAGTGTDPAPYFRIFNPVTQAREHDPEGVYVRRWVPELADLAGPGVHEPWKLPGGPPNGYPLPIVDHGAERIEALARYAEVRSTR